jgi:hypothetical protein
MPLTFGPGRTSQVVSVSVVDDGLLEILETFFGNLHFQSDGEVDMVKISPNGASVSVLDDDG